VACDVGQGDAILATYKNIQILTDGGPDNSVLNCLGKYMPFWDRNIELVISTHPDGDHSTGLIEVIKRYKVNKLLVNPIDPGTDVYRLLLVQAQSKKVNIINPENGMNIGLDLIHLDIVSRFDPLNKNTNDNSIVYKLGFGKFLGLFPGDMSPKVSDELATRLDSVDYIKIPHHGSINGLTQNLLEKTKPSVATISVSKKNMWGFPSEQILKMLNDKNIKILRTDEMGDIEIITNGNPPSLKATVGQGKYWIKK
jgi:competence protein ComEC